MKRQDIIDWLRRYSNHKMEVELLIIENSEKGTAVHLTTQGLYRYFQCGYAIGVLREKLRELDRKRDSSLRNNMKRRYNER